MVALLNAVVGVLLLTQAKHVDAAHGWHYRAMLGATAVMAMVLGYCLSAAERIGETVLELYLV